MVRGINEELGELVEAVICELDELEKELLTGPARKAPEGFVPTVPKNVGAEDVKVVLVCP